MGYGSGWNTAVERKSHELLRNAFMFAPWAYYVAIAVDVVLRLGWTPFCILLKSMETILHLLICPCIVISSKTDGVFDKPIHPHGSPGPQLIGPARFPKHILSPGLSKRPDSRSKQRPLGRLASSRDVSTFGTVHGRHKTISMTRRTKQPTNKIDLDRGTNKPPSILTLLKTSIIPVLLSNLNPPYCYDPSTTNVLPLL